MIGVFFVFNFEKMYVIVFVYKNIELFVFFLKLNRIEKIRKCKIVNLYNKLRKVLC